MDAKELANKLNGIEYPVEISSEIRTIAEENGLVIVYGASDDLMEFDGAIDEEMGRYGGDTAYLDSFGLMKSKCMDEDCPYFMELVKRAVQIEAVWNGDGNSCRSYKTDIPHNTFDVVEDGKVYCKGIVFGMTDLIDNFEHKSGV